MVAENHEDNNTSTQPDAGCTEKLLETKQLDEQPNYDRKYSHNDVTNDVDWDNKTSLDDGLKQKIPIDRGWAWVILAASTLEMFVVVGWFKCGGIFFVELQKKFKSSSSATSAVWSLMNGSFSLSAFCVMTFGQSMSSRVAVILGGTIVSLSFLVTAFMPSLQIAYFTHGILTGTFFAFIQPNVITMLNTYFEKRRGLALSIAGTGVSLGGLAMPPVYTKLFEYFGFTGTYMLVGAFMFHVTIVGALYRPFEYYKTRNRTKNVNGSPSDKSDRKSLIFEEDQFDSKELNGKLVCKVEHGSRDNKEIEILPPYTGNIYSSITDLAIAKSMTSICNIDNKNQEDKNISNASALVKASLAIFKKRVFQYYLLVNMMMCCGNVIVESYIAPHAFDMGIDRSYIALLIASISIADLCAKFVIGYLSDSKWISRSTIMALCACTLGVCSFFVIFMNSFTTLVIYTIAIGMLQPVYFTLFSVVAVDLLSLQELKGAMGFLSLAQGASNAVILPLAGYIRDVTGRYFGTFWLAGSFLIASGVLCFFLPNVKSYCDRQLQKSRDNKTEEDKTLTVPI